MNSAQNKEHSNRMHTTHSSLYGGLPDRDSPGQRPSDRDPPGQRPSDRDPPGQRPPELRPPWTEIPWKENGTRDRDPSRRNMGPGSQTGSGIMQRTPPHVARMTDMCKNFTLTQTSNLLR